MPRVTPAAIYYSSLGTVQLARADASGHRRYDTARTDLASIICSLKRFNLVLFGHQVEREVRSLAHLSDLLVNKELQVVILLVLEIPC